MPSWQEIHEIREWGAWPDTDLVRLVTRHYLSVLRCPEPRVLEVGIGGGANLRFFIENNAQVAGIDIAPAAVQSASKRLDGWYPEWRERGVPSSVGPPLVIGDACSLPWEDQTFDVVVDCSTLCYLSREDAIRAYAEVTRVAKAGAVLFVRAFSSGSRGSRLVASDMYDFSAGPLTGMPPTRLFKYNDILELTPNWTPIAGRHLSSIDPENHYCLSEWVLLLRLTEASN